MSANFNVDIEVTHSYIGDLEVLLEAPNGLRVILHSRSGSSNDNIIGNYPETLSSHDSLSQWFVAPIKGTWKLKVRDVVGGDTGRIVNWGINDGGDGCRITQKPSAKCSRNTNDIPLWILSRHPLPLMNMAHKLTQIGVKSYRYRYRDEMVVLKAQAAVIGT